MRFRAVATYGKRRPGERLLPCVTCLEARTTHAHRVTCVIGVFRSRMLAGHSYKEMEEVWQAAMLEVHRRKVTRLTPLDLQRIMVYMTGRLHA